MPALQRHIYMHSVYESSGVCDVVILALFLYMSVVDLNRYRKYTPSMELTHFSLW